MKQRRAGGAGAESGEGAGKAGRGSPEIQTAECRSKADFRRSRSGSGTRLTEKVESSIWVRGGVEAQYI